MKKKKNMTEFFLCFGVQWGAGFFSFFSFFAPQFCDVA
jgi:hypothetical protein